MRLAVVGANGATGIQVVRAALQRGIQVIPVVWSERHQERTASLFSVGEIRYANPEHPSALAAALQGADRVIGLLDPRSAGPGEPWVKPKSAENLVEVAARQGAGLVLMVSVMGAYRWSPFMLNRRAFRLEARFQAASGPWSMLRVSCYHDEVLEAHVRPPDGWRPRPIPSNGQYAPMSRVEAGGLILDAMERAVVGRVRLMGGPRLYTASALAALVEPFVRPGRRGRTTYPGLPRGDMGVSPADTAITTGSYPVDTLEAALRGHTRQPPSARSTVYPVGAPGPSAFDMGGHPPALAGCGPDLRRVVHEALVLDLRRRGIEPSKLDFSTARRDGRAVDAHDGTISEMKGVQALDPDGRQLYEGDVSIVRDALAEVFVPFFGAQIPAFAWETLDLGVRRRLKDDPRWRHDPRVVGWRP